ncbi:MAG: hypothetical protein UU93_C0006G0008 [Candidatus Amesbacteria bacterium GW2011_GWA2_42_12]|uniref:Uncharacterized protein n=1 Tax=Candidatus Amesbacteria bacterium GW2011_GWA2_42_12 TaxID=1618356 RepID=A0A0G0Y715_9BACT|nr:MAG: hypothetical protein UU93_C0006G0008 [Candidatus Amesbacteria bacterium GW2011_GWA2_42_12]
MHKAFTLVETVVSIGIFSVVIIMGTLMMVATLRASKKASAVALIRNEGSSALNIMTSYIRYASALDCTSAPSSISITPSNGDQIIFDCKTLNNINYIASNSASLTSSNVKVSSCDIFPNCVPNTSVDIYFSLIKTGTSLPIEQTASSDFGTTVVLRNK